jgi:thimet oligopeptidase
MKKVPYTDKDFAWVKWTPKAIEKIGRDAIEHKKAAYKKLKDILPEERTYENTVYALETADGPYGTMLRQMSLLSEVSPKEEVRTAAHAAINRYSSESVDVEYDRDLYISLLEYYEGNFSSEKKGLGKDAIKLLEDTMREYKRMGFDLPEKDQKRLKVLLKKSSEMGNNFRKNINDYQDYILCSDEELEGMSENYKAGLPRDEQSGKYIVSLQYPHIYPFLAEGKNREKREELMKKDWKKGGKKNLKLIHDIVKVRKEISSILGYAHHGDFRTENRMAKSAEAVLAFQDGLLKKIKPGIQKDLRALKEEANKHDISKVEAWDLSFLSTALKKDLFDYNPEYVREHFPFEHVRDVMLRHFGSIFGISFRELPFKLWHKDVKTFEVKDVKLKSLIGYISMDMFPRTGKFGHAAMFDTVVGRRNGWNTDEYIAPYSVMVCNFRSASKKAPSLLSLGEVETLFHEFGHGLHMTLSNARFESQSGANVAWDFVETPSQFMENWVWNDEMLKKLSAHYKTGKPLDKGLRTRIIASKKFMNPYAFGRQIMLGKLDMDLHTGKAEDGTKVWVRMMKEYFTLDLDQKDTYFPAGFGHLVGYDAGYYSYLWALVYAHDAFSEFEKKGLFNRDLGMKWRREVLEKGSTEDEIQLVKNFLGRKPSDKAFLREILSK